MANAFEPAGQDVLHEAPNEHWPRQAQPALFSLLARLAQSACTVGDFICLQRQDALVADGGAVCVATQLFQHLRRTAQRSRGEDHPVFLSQRLALLGTHEPTDGLCGLRCLPQLRHELGAPDLEDCSGGEQVVPSTQQAMMACK